MMDFDNRLQNDSAGAKRPRWPWVAALLALAIAAGGLAFAWLRDPGPPVPVGRLLFSDRPSYKLFRSGEPAPVDLELVRAPDVWSYELAFSPQGDRIAFENPIDYSIYVVDLDGSDLRRLTTSGVSSSPSWSPDGTQIIFASYDLDLSLSDPESEASGGFYSINADGSGLRRLPIPFGLLGVEPALSPDGRRLAYAYTPERMRFLGFGSDNTDIAVINLDGSGFALLAEDSQSESDPAWSPDGRTIAYVVGNSSFSMEIATVGADGTDQRRLTNNDVGDTDPVWSPDGRHLAFTRNPDGDDYRIFLMNADGTNQRFLHKGQYPLWAP